MDIKNAKKVIAEVVVSDTGYSRGFVYAQYPFIPDILKAFPATHLDVLYDKNSKEDAFKLKAKYGDRIKLLTGKREKYPTYTTPDGVVFYDYAIIRTENRQSSVWSQVYIGGVMLSDDEVRSKHCWIVVMGCNRGATKYIASLLNKCGIAVAHQGYGDDGIVGGGCAGTIPPPGSVVLHQVRHPLRVIEAVSTQRRQVDSLLATQLAKFPEPYIGYGYVGDPVLWGMCYWYYWNRLAERKALFTYRVEALAEVWEEFCFYVGIRQPMPAQRTDTNTRRGKVAYPAQSWKSLASKDSQLTEKIRGMAERYGYKL